MGVECYFYGPLRRAAGKRTVECDVPSGITVLDLIMLLAERDRNLANHLLDNQGNINQSVIITVDGTNITQLDKMETEIDDDSILRFSPPIVGG